MEWLADLRQLRFPREFRIDRPGWPSDFGVLSRGLGEVGATSRETKSDAPTENFEWLAALGTRLWRIKRRMVKPGSDEPLEEARRAYRHLESAWELLKDVGLEIQDHTNERVPDHGISAVRKIAFEPVAGLEFDTVVETVKPSIYYKGRLVQMGEVVVGTPHEH